MHHLRFFRHIVVVGLVVFCLIAWTLPGLASSAIPVNSLATTELPPPTLASVGATAMLSTTVSANAGSKTHTPTATETAKATVTAGLTPLTPPAADIRTALLSLEDLPAGFAVVTDQQLEGDEQALKSIGGVGTDNARMAVYLNPAVRTVAMHVLTSEPSDLYASNPKGLLNPVTILRQVVLMIAGPQARVKSVDVLPGTGRLGESSSGATFVASTADNLDLRIDAVFVQRDIWLSMVFLAYLDGSHPPVAAINLAKAADGRIDSVLAAALPAWVPSWPILVSDDFEPQTPIGWPLGYWIDAYGNIIRSVEKGKYRWSMEPAQGVVWRGVPSSIPALADFEVSVDAQRISGAESAAYGLVGRYDGANYYLFEIRDDQLFQFSVRYAGEWKTLVDWTRTVAIRPNEVNRLGIHAQGTHFTVYINNRRVAEVEDDHVKSGRAGVVTELFNPGESSDFEFDNFELRGPISAIPSPTAEPTHAPTIDIRMNRQAQ